MTDKGPRNKNSASAGSTTEASLVEMTDADIRNYFSSGMKIECSSFVLERYSHLMKSEDKSHTEQHTKQHIVMSQAPRNS
jgi:hypothetical protein